MLTALVHNSFLQPNNCMHAGSTLFLLLPLSVISSNQKKMPMLLSAQKDLHWQSTRKWRHFHKLDVSKAE
jgi:hypothetical protein